MTEEKSRAIIVHGHIFKNAGTSFDWALKNNFNENFIDHRDEDAKRGDSQYFPGFIEDNPSLQALASHHLYRFMPLPNNASVTLIPCFLIRHPIERVRSVYDFERRQNADTPGAIQAKKLSFKNYIEWRLNHKGGGVVMNYQVKYCSGRKGALIDSTHIEKTAEYLSSVALTGIVDRYDESMVFFEESLRNKFPDINLAYIKQNVSSRIKSSTTVEQKVAKVLRELGDLAQALEDNNKADLELYSRANEVLDLRIENIPSFSSKLEGFRERCKKVKRIRNR